MYQVVYSVTLSVSAGDEQTQGQINHCAGCTMGGDPPPPLGPDQLPNFYHTVLTFERSV